MRGADRQTESVSRADRRHGGDFRRRSLGVGQVFFTDLLPTVTTIRFQPTIVPKPKAIATATFTQVGMKRVE